ncbi:hypothetical protein CYMTET_22388 [Cymbomonas tetramitiformis]|uniref:Uncharacterized protein n=1 Tax=Cymbomonas tetramitiformis TaxID=36881 RepID=A0AAE0L288_9CHLO|nr:hypothetical protein CYMTET_43875 [Cymbomonas tetramitiformis]KAK3269149.1 hypothetical protein CYMTET_22388 [Cymbomonas tetramitiformis]
MAHRTYIVGSLPSGYSTVNPLLPVSIECLTATSASFQRASEEVMETAEAAGVGEEMAETVEELRSVVNAANGMATARVTEGLHHLQYILLSTLLEE